MRYFELNGQWWLPETPDHIVEGALSHTPDEGVTLNLQGDVAPSREVAWRFVERPVIWGEANGARVTLLGASTDVLWFHQEYRVRETYLGGHFAGAPYFEKFSVQLGDLDSFLGVNDSFTRLGLKDPDEQGELLSVATDEATIRFIQDVRLRERVERVEGVPRTHIEVVCSKPTTVRRVERSVVFPLQRLVALGTTENTRVDSLTGYAESAADAPPIEIIFAQREGLSRGKDNIPDSMLFSRFDLEEPERAITAWLALSATIPHVMHLFFDYAYFRRGDLTGGIVHIVQSLEGLHRDLKKLPKRRIPKNDFELLRDEFRQILGTTFPKKSEYQQWLADVLNPGVTLTERLKHLFDVHGEIMGELVADREEFVMTAKRLRNAFAHGLAIEELSSDDQRALFFLMEKLSVLFRACLLAELGMESSLRNTLFRRNQWFQHLRRSPHLEWTKWPARTHGTIQLPEE
jgi:hypothetical protein